MAMSGNLVKQALQDMMGLLWELSTAATAYWRPKRSHRALLQRQNLLLATLELWATDVVEALQAFTFQTLPLHSSVSTATARHCSVIAQLCTPSSSFLAQPLQLGNLHPQTTAVH